MNHYYEKQGRRLRCTILAGCLCAGLMFTGCSSGQTGRGTGSQSGTASTTEGASAASSAGVADTAAAAAASPTGAAGSTAAASASSTGATDSAAAADTGAQYSDPNWSSDQESVFSAKDKGLIIVLDPGHASQVPGTMEPVGPGSTEMKEADTEGTFGQASGLHEYELTMDVSKKVRAELEDRGYEVKLTHFDTFNPISCTERAAVANENEADAFIRIHANSTTDVKANGAMTICITEDNPFHSELYDASVRLSQILLDTYCEETGIAKEYVWKTDTMSGNNWSEVPTTMIELGYMSNPDEDLNMAQDSQQLRMAKAIADSLDLWFGLMPEEELSMHPGLTGEVPGRSTSPAPAAVTSGGSTGNNANGSAAGQTQENADTASTAGSAAVPAGTAPAAVPAGTTPAAVPAGTTPAAVPAGTSTGVETAVPADRSGTPAPGTLELEEGSSGEEEGSDIISEENDQN